MTSTATLPTASTSPAVDRRYEFVLLFDVKNGNPNGDPDAGNAPRVDPETGHGLVSDVCLKRKVRNFICLAKGNGTPERGYDIYVKERAVLNEQHQKAYDALGGSAPPEPPAEADDKPAKGAKKGKAARPAGAAGPDEARVWMCQNFFDIRMFGAVMTTGVNAGQVRGPVQLTFSRSIDPIVALEQSITRMAVTTAEESKKQEGGNRTMGRKEIVPYALYRVHGFINPFLAAQTGFNADDLELLWRALEGMFEHDRSAARGEMSSCKLLVFEHETALGNAPARRLFDLVQVKRRDASRPPRDFGDYEVSVNRGEVPAGVTLHERL